MYWFNSWTRSSSFDIVIGVDNTFEVELSENPSSLLLFPVIFAVSASDSGKVSSSNFFFAFVIFPLSAERSFIACSFSVAHFFMKVSIFPSILPSTQARIFFSNSAALRYFSNIVRTSHVAESYSFLASQYFTAHSCSARMAEQQINLFTSGRSYGSICLIRSGFISRFLKDSLLTNVSAGLSSKVKRTAKSCFSLIFTDSFHSNSGNTPYCSKAVSRNCSISVGLVLTPPFSSDRRKKRVYRLSYILHSSYNG